MDLPGTSKDFPCLRRNFTNAFADTSKWNDKPKKVKDVVYKILKITDKASCLIAMGMAYAPPYISLPWAAIGAILPVSCSSYPSYLISV